MLAALFGGMAIASAFPQDIGDAAFARLNVLATHPAPIGRGHPSILPPIDGDLVYSHYDENGNTQSIVQFDFANGRWSNLVSGKRDPTLIAQDSRYIVSHTFQSASFPIEVIDRKTGVVLKRIRLAKVVREAFIDGDRLVLFQGERTYNEQAVAILELPSLKLIRETELPGAQLISIRNGHVYTASPGNGKNELVVFDRQLRELGRIEIPPPLEKINANCQPTIEQDDHERAVLIANCGEMHVLDLKSFSITHSMRRYALFYSMALHNGLMFTTASDKSASDDVGIVVFDMDTGKEVAHLPISASTIAIKGNILLAAHQPVSMGLNSTWPMDTYQINADAIRDGRWQQARVVQQCRQAETQWEDKKDLYAAIGLCKQAGIEAYARGTSIPATVLPALRQYGLWLSQTLDQSPEAVQVLEMVQAAKPEQSVALALDEARLKARVIGGETTNELTEAERETNFGQVFEDGVPLTKAITKTIEFGFFSDLFYFSGDRLYVGRYGCGTTSCEGGTTLGVFDRNTLDELASVPIAPDDHEYQDSIASIAADEKHIYASVSYRYEQKGRPNFLVIDPNTLKVTKRVQVESIGKLYVARGRLLSCGSLDSLNDACADLDPVTLKLTEAPDMTYVKGEPGDDAIVTVDRTVATEANFVAVTRDYLVVRRRMGTNAEYMFYPRAGGKPLPPVRDLGNALERAGSVDGNNILIREPTLRGQLIKLVSLPSGAAQTILGLPVTPSRVPVPMLRGQTLYVGYGRDLFVYDLRDRRIRRYIKDFIPTGFNNNGFGLDTSRIDRLIIDQDRLIALTFRGASSRIIRLSDL